MGKSVTPPYRLEMSGTTHSAWRVKEQYGIPGDGQPNDANLMRYLLSFAASLKLGGTNQHISKALGYIPYPTWARIIRQRDGKIMASWIAPAFMVWP